MKASSARWRRVEAAGAGVLLLALLVALVLPWIEAAAMLHERLVTTAFGIAVYLATFMLSALLFALPQRRRHATSFRRACYGVLRWIWRWHGMVAIAMGAGALLGAVLYTLGGLLLGFEGTAREFALQGLRDGAFYLLIWSPGGALVLCFMQAFGPSRESCSPVPSTENL